MKVDFYNLTKQDSLFNNMVEAMIIHKKPEQTLENCLQTYTKKDMLVIAEYQAASVKKSYPKADVAADLSAHMISLFKDAIPYLTKDETDILESLSENTSFENIESLPYSLRTLYSFILNGILYLYYSNGTFSLVFPEELKTLYTNESHKQEVSKSLLTNQQLDTYLVAFTKLYGVFDLDHLHSVWNRNHKDQLLTLEDIQEKIVELAKRSDIYSLSYKLVFSTHYLDIYQAKKLYQEARGYRYFTPKEVYIRKWAEEESNKRSTYFKEMQKFLQEVVPNKLVDKMAHSIAISCKFENQLQDVLNELKNAYHFEFLTQEEIEAFAGRYMALASNTRKWIYRGHTPMEINRSKKEKKASQPLDTSQPVHVPKVGRNDPCPCGSGKKYKKCHGR
nr:SEC-C domain-containing protein [Lacticigenium naphthae]